VERFTGWRWNGVEWSGVIAALWRDAGPQYSDFWRSGETGAVACGLAGRRKASGLPGPASARTDFGGVVRAEVSARPDARPAG